MLDGGLLGILPVYSQRAASYAGRVAGVKVYRLVPTPNIFFLSIAIIKWSDNLTVPQKSPETSVVTNVLLKGKEPMTASDQKLKETSRRNFLKGITAAPAVA